MVGALGEIFSVVRHELKVLAATVTLKTREDAHWDIVSDILEHLFPAIDCGLEGKYLLHALIDTQLAHCNCAPDCTQRCLILVQIINILFQGGDLFLIRGNCLLDVLDAFNRFLEAFKVVNLAPDPVYDVLVGVAELGIQTVHHLVKLVIRMRHYTLLLVGARVEVEPSVLVLDQLAEKGLYTQSYQQSKRKLLAFVG